MAYKLMVEHGGLDATSGDLTGSAGHLQSRLTQLESDIRGKVAPYWTGQANESFVAAKAKWDQGMTELRELLNTIGTGVGTANEEFRGSDNRGAGRFAV